MLDAPFGLRPTLRIPLSGCDSSVTGLVQKMSDVLVKASRWNAAEATDGDGTHFSAHDEGVHGGAPDSEPLGGFFNGENDTISVGAQVQLPRFICVEGGRRVDRELRRNCR